MTDQALIPVWTTDDVSNPHRLGDKHRRVRRMFSDLAQTYDLANHVLSLNLDRYWRRRAVELMDLRAGHRVLDLCCGTGDLAFLIAKKRSDVGEIIGLDFAEPMLTLAQEKNFKLIKTNVSTSRNSIIPKWLCSDAAMAPLADGYFDRIGCVFGMRNMQYVDQFLSEVYRLLKPCGRAVILEFAMPERPVFRWAYQCYFRLVLPLIGCMMTSDRNRAYHYLAGSVNSFPGPEKLKMYMRRAGFYRVEAQALSGGVVMAYLADKE